MIAYRAGRDLVAEHQSTGDRGRLDASERKRHDGGHACVGENRHEGVGEDRGANGDTARPRNPTRLRDGPHDVDGHLSAARVSEVHGRLCNDGAAERHRGVVGQERDRTRHRRRAQVANEQLRADDGGIVGRGREHVRFEGRFRPDDGRVQRVHRAVKQRVHAVGEEDSNLSAERNHLRFGAGDVYESVRDHEGACNAIDHGVADAVGRVLPRVDFDACEIRHVGVELLGPARAYDRVVGGDNAHGRSAALPTLRRLDVRVDQRAIEEE